MPRNDDAEDSLSGYLSSDDRGVRSDSSNEEDEGETEDEKEDNVNQETVGMFDSVDFLTPGGLSSFTVALPSKSDKLVLKDLPKTIKASVTSKKSFRVTMEVLNSGIVSLWKTAVSENNNARSIHDTAKGALRRGGKTLTS